MSNIRARLRFTPVRPFPRDQIVDAIDETLSHLGNGYYEIGAIIVELDRHEELERAAVDCVIQTVSRRLIDGPCGRGMLRRTGDGTIMIVPSPLDRVGLDQLRDLSTTISTTGSRPIPIDGVNQYFTFSCGYANAAQLIEPSGTAILDAAQHALQRARIHGPASCQAYDPDLEHQQRTAVERRKILLNALSNGEIHAHFQPQVDIDTGLVIGFEALARWQHPERGQISPAEFLPQLEDLNLMPELGMCMLRCALQALRQWRQDGFAVPAVSVNFSTEELRNPNLPEFVTMELEKNDIEASSLVVEVLETVVASTDNSAIKKNLQILADLGCKLDLDDFGTGNASITTIQSFAVDRIKIDKSFISHGHSDTDARSMVEAMIAISEKLRVETLAEGAETAEDLMFLRAINCPIVQGFAIAPPLPPNDVTNWLRSWFESSTNLANTPQTLTGS